MAEFYAKKVLKEFSQRRSVIAEGFWVVSGQGAVAIAGLFSVAALTRLLTPEDYGAVVLGLGMAGLALGISSNSVLQASMRIFSGLRSSLERKALEDSAFKLIKALNYIGFVAIFAYSYNIFGFTEEFAQYAFVLMGILIADSRRSLRTSLLNAARNQKKMSIWRAADAWARPLFAVIALWIFGLEPITALAAYLVAGLLTNLVFESIMPQSNGAYLEVQGNPELVSLGRRQEISTELRSYSLTLLPLGVAGWILGVGDRYIVAEIAGVADAGLYAAAYAVASRPYLALGSVLDPIFRPRLYDAVASSTPITRLVISWLSCAFAAGFSIFFAVLYASELIVSVLLGERFQGLEDLIVLIAAAYVLFNTQIIFGRICHAYKRPSYVVGIQGLAALFNIPASIYGATNFGLHGVAIASLATFALQNVTGVYLCRRAQNVWNQGVQKVAEK